jgi:hypothetical protein
MANHRVGVISLNLGSFSDKDIIITFKFSNRAIDLYFQNNYYNAGETLVAS